MSYGTAEGGILKWIYQYLWLPRGRDSSVTGMEESHNWNGFVRANGKCINLLSHSYYSKYVITSIIRSPLKKKYISISAHRNHFYFNHFVFPLLFKLIRSNEWHLLHNRICTCWIWSRYQNIICSISNTGLNIVPISNWNKRFTVENDRWINCHPITQHKTINK